MEYNLLYFLKVKQKMFKKSKEMSYAKSTREGRLYIPTKDFFKQDKVKQMVTKLINSSVYKDIEKKKNNTTKLGAA